MSTTIVISDDDENSNINNSYIRTHTKRKNETNDNISKHNSRISANRKSTLVNAKHHDEEVDDDDDDDDEYIDEDITDEPKSIRVSKKRKIDLKSSRKLSKQVKQQKYEFTQADIIECFKVLDHSESGSLSVDDLVSACVDINEELVVEDIEDMLNEADSRGDMDGEVGVKDLINMAKIVGLIPED
jgi:hypothetical protein